MWPDWRAGSSVSFTPEDKLATLMRPPFFGVCAWAVLASDAMLPASVACMPPAANMASTSRREAPRRSEPIMRALSSGPTSTCSCVWLLLMIAPLLKCGGCRVGTQGNRSGPKAVSASGQPVLQPEVHAHGGKEPGGTDVTGNGRPGAALPGVGAFVAGHHLGHSLAHQHRHLRAVAAVAHRIEQAVALARMGQAVLRHVHQAAPCPVGGKFRPGPGAAPRRWRRRRWGWRWQSAHGRRTPAGGPR